MTEMVETETRLHPRTPFRCRAKLAIGEKPALDVVTADISPDGISLMIDQPIDPGQYCVIKFEVTVNGAARQFSSIGKSIYCVPGGRNVSRIGFQFLELNATNAAIIKALQD